MKFQSQVIASASGSVGGLTFSRNRSGQYCRRRSVPVNPGSPQQSITQGLFSLLVTAWTQELTQTQRDGWDTWAINTPQFDALGQPITITGQNAYIKMNSLRMQNLESRIDDAPAVFAGASLTPPTLTVADVSGQTLTVTFDNTDQWAGAVGGGLAIYMGRPQNPSVQFFKGPYRRDIRIAGAAVPPTSPQSGISAIFPFVLNQRIHVAFRCYNADGRISAQTRSSVISTA